MSGHAIIGCGRVAPNHVDGFRALPSFDLRWACDRDPLVAEAFAKSFGIHQASTSIDDVLRDPEVASVSVAVDHAHHFELVEAALHADKHVLVEKPLALSASAGKQLIALATERGLVLSVVSQHRFDPVVVAVHGWLAEGLLGRLLFVQASLEACREPEYYSHSYWRGTWEGEGGSALINQGYHCLDITRYLCGDLELVAAVGACQVLKNVIETEDTLSALFRAGSTSVTLNVTVASTTVWRTRLELVGSHGSVCLDIDHPGALHRVEGNPEIARRAAELPQPDGSEPPPGVGYYGISHRRQIADFAAAVHHGKPLMHSPETALGTTRLLEEVYDMVKRNR